MAAKGVWAGSDENGGRKPTINDVARLAGVSKKTVSRVINRSPLLNEETRERVEKVIRELGYVPNPQARALALRRNFLIGLIHDNPNAQMVLNMQQGILEALQGTEFEMVVRPVDRNSSMMLDDVRLFLERQRLFGVVILPPISENDALAAALRRGRLPLRADGLGPARRCRAYGRLERPRGGARGDRPSDPAGPPADRPDRRARTASARRASGGSASRMR